MRVLSLGNIITLPDVIKLLDFATEGRSNDPSFVPGMQREQAQSIISAVLWMAGSRSDSFANAYAHDAWFNAIGEDGINWLAGRLEFEKGCVALHPTDTPQPIEKVKG